MPHLFRRFEPKSGDQWRPQCVICRKFVQLEESKADEHGRAIHEECYIFKVVGKQTIQRRHQALNRL